MFPSSYPARYFRNEGFILTGKEIELPWQPRAQHPFIYIGFYVRLAKSFNRSGKIFFQSKLCHRSIWRGCGFPIRNLEGQKKRKVKASQFAIAINTLTRPQPTQFTFSFTRLNWPFITRVPGVYLLPFLLSFSRSQTCPSRLGEVLISGQLGRSSCCEVAVKWLKQSYTASARAGGNKYLYITDRPRCQRLFLDPDGAVHWDEVPSLQCDHEEADTRLLLHSAHAASTGYQTVIIN